MGGDTTFKPVRDYDELDAEELTKALSNAAIDAAIQGKEAYALITIFEKAGPRTILTGLQMEGICRLDVKVVTAALRHNVRK